MAAKKSVKKDRVEWQGYLRVNLTDEQDAAFSHWMSSNSVSLSDLDILTNNGYKVSVAWDDYHNGVVASMTANSKKLPQAGWVLTAWADNTQTALELLLYKHYVVCEEDWEAFKDVVDKTNRSRG